MVFIKRLLGVIFGFFSLITFLGVLINIFDLKDYILGFILFIIFSLLINTTFFFFDRKLLPNGKISKRTIGPKNNKKKQEYITPFEIENIIDNKPGTVNIDSVIASNPGIPTAIIETKLSKPKKKRKIKASERYAFKYIDTDGNKSQREIVFIRADKNNGKAYLIGICSKRNTRRTFRADRMTDLIDLDTGEYIEEAEKYISSLYFYR